MRSKLQQYAEQTPMYTENIYCLFLFCQIEYSYIYGGFYEKIPLKINYKPGTKL